MWHGPLRTTLPSTRINDDLMLDHYYWDIINRHQHQFVGKNNKHKLITGATNDSNTKFLAPFLKHCFVYVITETVGDYPYPYFSEKTWKAMTSKVPFMIVGAQSSLAKLHEFGFKTFRPWWNEDYDSLPTVSQRIESMILELKKLSTYSTDKLCQLQKEMQPVIQHNFDNMSTFTSADIANVRNKL